MYLIRVNAANLLIHKNDSVLPNEIRCAIVNHFVDFMVEAFGNGDVNKITPQQRNNTARIAIKMFKAFCYEDSEIGGIVS